MAEKPFVSEKNRKSRLQFAKDHLTWTVDDWKRVLWSDEVPKNKRYDPKYTKGTVKNGGGKVMIWGCFSWHGLGPLAHIKKNLRSKRGGMDSIQYRDEILAAVMLPYAAGNLENWIFMHDNDPKHASHLTSKWLSDNSIHMLNSPPQSPDLNPIENLWWELKRRLAGKKFNEDQTLFEAVKQEWSRIPKNKLDNLIESMPRRMKCVIEANGYATKY